MEKFYSDLYENKGKLSFSDIRKFLYYENYERLIGIELNLCSLGSEEKIAFVGSGALPLSPILLNLLSPTTAISLLATG